jgi:hypothetical protein
MWRDLDPRNRRWAALRFVLGLGQILEALTSSCLLLTQGFTPIALAAATGTTLLTATSIFLFRASRSM